MKGRLPRATGPAWTAPTDSRPGASSDDAQVFPFRVVRGFPIDGMERNVLAEGEMRRVLLAMFAVLSLSSCYAHEYAGPDRQAYRHERWHGEDVYRREDGRWYARRNNEWVLEPGVEDRDERRARHEREEREEHEEQEEGRGAD